jgi:hypothetical protein
MPRRIPGPGQLVRGTRSGRSVTALIDLIGRSLGVAHHLGAARRPSHVSRPETLPTLRFYGGLALLKFNRRAASA